MSVCFVALVSLACLGAVALAQDQQPEPQTPLSPPAAAARAAPLPATAGKMLTFKLLIADVAGGGESPTVANILELEKAGKLNFAIHLQLSSLDGQPASVQFGQLRPRVTGRSTVGFRGGRGGPGGPPGVVGQQTTPTYANVSIGTLAQITARIEDDGSIVAQLGVERSDFSGDETAFDPNVVTPPAPIERFTTSTTVRLKPDEPQIVGGQKTSGANGANKTWIVISAVVGPNSAAAKAK